VNEQEGRPPELGISAEEWAKTPASVQAVVLTLYPLIQRVKELETEVAQLREQVKRNSGNSSQPPSSDGPGKVVRGKPQPKGRARGGQPGHEGQRRELVPVEQVKQVVAHKPEVCSGCGAPLAGEDPLPYRYQVTDLPPMKPEVIEHQVHTLTCPCCGRANRGQLPPEVAASQFGPRVVGLMAVLMGVYRLSKRQVAALLADCCAIDVAASSVVNQQQAVSEALLKPVEEVLSYVQAQAVRNVDETGWPQAEGEQRGWLWVVVTPVVTLFRVALSRAGQVAQDLLGRDTDGIVGSDRFNAYNWLPLNQRQVCWAHLLRDFQKLVERGGGSARVGQPLRTLAEELLTLWARVRDGTLTPEAFLTQLPAFQHTIRHFLSEGAHSAHPQTAETCRRILLVEPALWTFTAQPGVEPTNNAAERALRQAVIWRRISYGTQSEAGSRFVERILSVVETCRQQGNNPLDYLCLAVAAHRSGQRVPSLLPASNSVTVTP
jgi:transposase